MSTTKRFRLEGIVYELGSQSDVSLRDFLLLEQETAVLGRIFTMGDIVRLAEKFQTLSETEARHHPEGAWMLASTIWIAMIRKARQQGDKRQVMFSEAIDSDLSTFEQLPDPLDRAPGKSKPAARKKAAKKTGKPTPARTRRSSVQDSAAEETDPEPTES